MGSREWFHKDLRGLRRPCLDYGRRIHEIVCIRCIETIGEERSLVNGTAKDNPKSPSKHGSAEIIVCKLFGS